MFSPAKGELRDAPRKEGILTTEQLLGFLHMTQSDIYT